MWGKILKAEMLIWSYWKFSDEKKTTDMNLSNDVFSKDE